MFTQTTQPYTKSCHQSNSSFVVVTIRKTSWDGSKKFEDIAFENTPNFCVPNGRIYPVPFNDCKWEESVFEKVMSNFNQGNTINISRRIIRCSKPFIFKNFLVVESFIWSNYRLTVHSSDYILKLLHQECFLGNLPLGLFRSRRPQPSIFENFSRKYRWWSPSFGQITDWLFRVAIILKWLHQECFLGNPPKDFGAPKCHRL